MAFGEWATAAVSLPPRKPMKVELGFDDNDNDDKFDYSNDVPIKCTDELLSVPNKINMVMTLKQ
jgi:hypothetical protein